MSKNNTKSKPDKWLMSINSYSGDPDITAFFFKQIKDIQNLNGWDDSNTLMFLRSKLSGAALKFYIESPQLQTENSIDAVQAEFIKFFRPINQQQASQKWTSLKMQEFESVRNLSHRIDALFPKAFPNIIDPNSVNVIKFNQFLSTIPVQFKIRILEQEITDYNLATDKAQLLQDIEQQNSSKNSLHTMSAENSNSPFEAITEQLNVLSKEISNLKKFKENSKNDESCNFNRRKVDGQTNQQYHYNKNFRNKNSKPYMCNTGRNQQNKKHFRSYDKNLTCNFCNGKNHKMRFCRYYLATLPKSNQPRQSFQNEFQQNRQNSRFHNQNFSQLNPSAQPFSAQQHSEN